ncbi:murein hydrolase activator EnvC family protein [Krasilnikovia sp. MM14-A1004]|uniref:murein hydrolase activator EnvC family protein n=1 Tax=Krasilnikovia sp. MM14-A1004 TaxID=3373541 RepID=UPI00399CCC98
MVPLLLCLLLLACPGCPAAPPSSGPVPPPIADPVLGISRRGSPLPAGDPADAGAGPLMLFAGPQRLLPAAPERPGRPMSQPPGEAGARFRWPLDAPHVVRGFAPPPRPWLPGHRGVDLAAPPATPVQAAGPGIVVFAAVLAGRGVVSVAHPGGLRTTYEPVDPVVRAGATVAAGQRIGTLRTGHPGCPAPACLHWGVRRGETYLDPLALLGLRRVRLLPLIRPTAATAADTH